MFEVSDTQYQKITHDLAKYGKRAAIGVAGLVAGSVLIANTLYTIESGEIGIVTRFGEVQRIADPGLGVKIPFIEGVTAMSTRIQKETANTSAATKDMQDVKAELALNYSIDKETGLNIYKDLGISYKDNVVIPALHESFKAGAAQYTAEELITKRPEAKEKILESIKERLAGYGIVAVDLNITNLDFSDEFNKAIENKMIAQQEVEKAKQDLERVKIEAEQKVAEAKADAEAQKLQQSTLTELMIKKMYIEKWDGKLPEVASGDSGIILNMGK